MTQAENEIENFVQKLFSRVKTIVPQQQKIINAYISSIGIDEMIEHIYDDLNITMSYKRISEDVVYASHAKLTDFVFINHLIENYELSVMDPVADQAKGWEKSEA
jgi:nitrogenase subunit NifH